MRFVINGEDAFDVPETCLRKRASSLLTAVTACRSGEVRQLDPAAARLVIDFLIQNFKFSNVLENFINNAI